MRWRAAREGHPHTPSTRRLLEASRGTPAPPQDLLFRPCASTEDGDECPALPDPVLRLAEVPAYLEDSPPPSKYAADDLVVGALLGVDLNQV